ncbi:MAG: diaminopimelate decarboxylase [Candidatus Brocadiia bacterium]
MDTSSGFHYLDGHLHCDGHATGDIAADYGTPCYIYSGELLRKRFTRIRDAFGQWSPLVCFSVKCLANLSVLRLLADSGCGFDVVSGGEIYRVVRAGGDPSKIVFAGVGKTRAEISYALRQGVHMFNVESKAEMHAINEVAVDQGAVARVAIRVNPDIDARTHEKTTTGKEENKFGVSASETVMFAEQVKQMDGVELCGLHVHLGSPIYSVDPYVRALEKILSLRDELISSGIDIETINLGGGYCMSYTGEEVIGPADYAESVRPFLAKLNCDLIIEPGRHIAAPSGVLLVKVIYRKERPGGKTFLICDGGMNVMMRPTLYGAFHRIWPIRSPGGMPDVMSPEDDGYAGFETERVDVVGPICESGDYLAESRQIPSVPEGSILAVFDAGAYGFTMSNQYNAQCRPPEILTEDTSVELIRERESYEDLVEYEVDE